MKKFSSNARITELDALSNAVIRIYQANKEVAHDAFLKSVMDEIVGISANLTSAIGQDRILSGLEDADTARDLAVKKLGTALAGYAVLPIEAKKGAAEKLLAIFNKYGKQIAKANYASESSLIESMLEDFGKEGVTECIQELCGIPEMIAEIRTSQDNFVQVNDAYTANSVNKSASASSFKKMLFFAINDKLLPYLSAMQLANAKAYGEMASKVECEIARVNEIVNKRKKTATPKNPTEKTAE